MFFRRLNLSAQESKAFRLHTLYSLIEGVILGVLALNEFVFLKSLHGSNYQLGVLFQFSTIVFTFLILLNEFLKRIRNRKKLLRITGIATRAPLLLLMFFPATSEAIHVNSVYHYIFLGIFLVYYFGNSVIFPTINFFLKSNYRHQNFGKLYSYSTSLNKVIMLIITFAYGLMLDADNYVYVYVFPVIAVLGVVSVYLLSLISYPLEEGEVEKSGFWKSVLNSGLGMLDILKKNKPYLHFEIGFMLYGFAFMITYPVIYIYFYEALELNYSSVAFYRNSYNILAIIILPFAGKLLGNIDPRKFAVITFSSIMLYIFFLALTQFLPGSFEFFNITIYYTMIFYILFHGVFAATMVLLWNIGSAYFGPSNEAGTYQSVHLSLTGIRSLFAPLLGVFFYELYGFAVTFGIGILSLLIGILLNIWSYKRDRK